MKHKKTRGVDFTVTPISGNAAASLYTLIKAGFNNGDLNRRLLKKNAIFFNNERINLIIDHIFRQNTDARNPGVRRRPVRPARERPLTDKEHYRPD